jgi:putative hydrolase of the HAD superfamily
MPLETLFLDAGGVLVHPNWSRVAETLKRHGVAARAEELAAAEPYAKRELDVPARLATINDDRRGWLYFNLVLARARIAVTDAVVGALQELRDYHARVNLWEHVPEEVADALARLRGLGLKLVVVSNANGTLRRAFDRLGLTSRVDHLFDSDEEGVEKPDPAFFRIALERTGSRRESTCHVGDLYQVDVLGARAAGLRAVLFDPADLYADRDCLRVRSLLALAEGIAAGRLD